MLTIENKKREPVVFNWVDDNETIQLQITQMTVADRLKLSTIHGELIDMKDIDDDTRGALFLTSRVMCSVKTLDNKYFFTDDVKALHDKLSGEVLYQLSAEIGDLNPIDTSSIDDAKK